MPVNMSAAANKTVNNIHPVLVLIIADTAIGIPHAQAAEFDDRGYGLHDVRTVWLRLDAKGHSSDLKLYGIVYFCIVHRQTLLGDSSSRRGGRNTNKVRTRCTLEQQTTAKRANAKVDDGKIPDLDEIWDSDLFITDFN
jgi:hypothetical protein